MEFPEELKYYEEHTWVRVEGKRAFVGITDYAQKELGEILYVELPEVEEEFDQGETFGTVESSKAVSELIAPISGKVVRVNESLEDEPELINEDPYGDGWMIVMEMGHESELDSLLSAEEYQDMMEEEEE